MCHVSFFLRFVELSKVSQFHLKAAVEKQPFLSINKLDFKQYEYSIKTKINYFCYIKHGPIYYMPILFGSLQYLCTCF